MIFVFDQTAIFLKDKSNSNSQQKLHDPFNPNSASMKSDLTSSADQRLILRRIVSFIVA
jgi:hypothetical protein